MQKVLLLNPPGKERYLRDYFCSKISKSGYLYQSIDLLVLSGILTKHFEVAVLDSIVEKDSPATSLEKIRIMNPDFIIFLTGSVSFSEDMHFIEQLKTCCPKIKKIIGIGDIFFDDTREKLRKHPELDAILFDFTTNDVLNYLQEKKCNNIVYRRGNEIFGQWERPSNQEFSIPIPRHDLFPNNKYNYPFIKHKPFTLVLTNFGCPYQCSFCIMPSLGFKTRQVDNILAELECLKANGFKSLYFNDQTFGANKKQTIELLNKMIAKKLNFGWVCFSRVDLINEEFLSLMKKAGGQTIMFGIETADQALLDQHNKKITLERITETVKLCKKYKIEVLGTFILGLPGETKASALKTIDFAKELDLDYVAFNIAIPRKGTPLREQSIKQGLIDQQLEEMDQSGSKALIKNNSLSFKEIEDLQHKAYRDFYFRPKKIIKFILSIRSWDQLNNYIHNGWEVLSRYANFFLPRR